MIEYPPLTQARASKLGRIGPDQVEFTCGAHHRFVAGHERKWCYLCLEALMRLPPPDIARAGHWQRCSTFNGWDKSIKAECPRSHRQWMAPTTFLQGRVACYRCKWIDSSDNRLAGDVYIALLPGERGVHKIGHAIVDTVERRIRSLGYSLKTKLSPVLIERVIDAWHVEQSLLRLGTKVDLGDVQSRSEYRALTDNDLIAARRIVERFKPEGPLSTRRPHDAPSGNLLGGVT